MFNNNPGMQGKIVDYVRRYGPVLPVKISKEIGSNILFAGALLSELVRNKRLLISNAKIGGSPVYYIQGQEAKLAMLSEYLGEKEKKAYELIQEKKVLDDKKLESWQRVAIRSLVDFAVPVKNKEGKLFWRWYLINDSEIEKYIESSKAVVKVEKQNKKRVVKKQRVPTTSQKKLQDASKVNKKIIKTIKDDDSFKQGLFRYFQKKQIDVLECKTIRKKTDYEFIVTVGSGIGNVKFFVKVRGKKKISDGDLSLAFDKSRANQLPLYFLSTGELTKKGREYAEKNDLKFEKLISL